MAQPKPQTGNEARKIIKEIDNGLAKLSKLAGALEPESFGYIPQKAIISLVSGIYGIRAIHLGELKNAFGIGIKTRKLADGTLEIVE